MPETNEEENSAPQNDEGSTSPKKWKIKPTKAQLYMIAAGTIIVIAVSVLLYSMPAKKEVTGHKSQYKKSVAGQEPYKKELHKIMTASRQNALKPAGAGADHRFANSTAAKRGYVPNPTVAAKAEMKSPSLLDVVTSRQKRVLSPYLLHKLNSRYAVKGKKHVSAPLAASMAIPQKPAIPVPVQVTQQYDPRESARKQTAENIKMFIAKGWTPYYTHDNEVLLYRAPDDGGTESRKMINTAWFLGDENIILFANALNCADKSIDTFAYMELDAQTLKTTGSRARDIAEKGVQQKDIQEPSDLALHGKVCR